MFPVIVAVLVISTIAAALALVLVVSERLIANYGPCEININGKKKYTVQGGKTLLSELLEQKIFIPSACGGRGTCGYCKTKITHGAGPLLPTETPFLTAEEIETDVRLSCQVKVRQDIRLEIPAELLTVKEYTCRCTDITDLTHDTKQFRFELIEPDTIDYVPGQYVQLLTPVYEHSSEEVYRAYSVSSDPKEKNAVELIIRLVPSGICTTYCFNYLKVDDEAKINGPYGDFGLSDTDTPMIFIAGGSGMAPIKCLLHQMKNTGCARKTVYYFGANKVKELFLTDMMKEFERDLADFCYVPVVAQPEDDETWDGQRGLVTEAVMRDIKDASAYEAYPCGSPGMIDASIKVLKDLGIVEDRIYYHKFE